MNVNVQMQRELNLRAKIFIIIIIIFFFFFFCCMYVCYRLFRTVLVRLKERSVVISLTMFAGIFILSCVCKIVYVLNKERSFLSVI